MTTPPAIVTGPDGLPHCRTCAASDQLCRAHAAQVTATLNSLRTAVLLGRAQHDLRALLKSRRLARREDTKREDS